MTIFQTPLFSALGWALMHFLWQGALIALVVAVALAALGRRSARTRYLVCCAGLFAMALAPVATFIVVMTTAGPAGEIDATTATALVGLTLPAPAGIEARLAPMVPALTLCWLVGIALMHMRLAFQLGQAQGLKRRGVSAAPAPWASVVADLCVRLAIRRPVRIVESCMVRVPTLVGYFEPVILIPASAWLGLTTEQLRAVVTHELAHVRRHDYLVNLIQAVLEALLFYHPAVWWLSGRLRVEREYCCDDIAVAVGGGRLCYAQALSTLDDLRGSTLQPTLASTGGSLMNRIRRLAGAPLIPSRPAAGWITSAGVTLAFLATATGLSYPQATQRHERQREHEVHREHGEHAVLKAIPNVNLVEILENIDPDRAEIVRALRETGMTNDQLLTVLEVLGTDKATFDAITRAARRQSFIDRHVHPVHERVARDLANGTLTEREAALLLAYAETEAGAILEHRPSEKEIGERIKTAIEESRGKIDAAVAAGELTPEQAERKLRDIRREMTVKVQHEFMARARDDARQEFMDREMRRMHDQVAEDIELGRLSEDEARTQLKQLHVRLVEWWDANGPAIGPPRDKIAAKLHDVRTELEHAVAEGKLTEEEAAQKLEAIERKLAAEREHIERDVHAKRQRDVPSPGEIVWVSLAPALARAAETGSIDKSELKMIHEGLLAHFNRAMAVEGGPEQMHAAMKPMFDHIVARLTEHGVPEDELREAIDAAQRNLIRHMARHDWHREQDQRRKRELELHEDAHPGG